MRIKLKRATILYLLLIVSMGFLGACSSKQNDKQKGFSSFFGSDEIINIDELQAHLQRDLEDSLTINGQLRELNLTLPLRKHFQSFYKLNAYAPVWVDEYGVTNAGKDLLETIEKAPDDGLKREDYRLQYLYYLKQKIEAEEEEIQATALKLEKEYTAAYMLFATHLLQGKIDPTQYDSLWKVNRREKNLATILHNAIAEDEVSASLASLLPNYKEYAGLKKALAVYRKLEQEQGGWPQLPQKIVLKKGDTSEHIATLRKRLSFTDEYAVEKVPDSLLYVYDSLLVQSVIDFQITNGLEPTGVVNQKTVEVLNLPLNYRISQLELNLERLRWLPEKPTGKHVIVNVPEYMLYVYNGEEDPIKMKVIVGKSYGSTTPIFNDSIEYIAFSPTWTVPKSIATNEILPAVQKNPAYLASRNFEVYDSWKEDAVPLDPDKIDWKAIDIEKFPYRIVQLPGSGNALGQVKFVCPNHMDIYLHDTPSGHLFDKAERALSHGCIRVEKPIDLAVYLLDKGWEKDKVKEYMNRTKTENIKLPNKVPLIIEYRTAWLDDNDKVNFREDIYGHDRKQILKLTELLAIY